MRAVPLLLALLVASPLVATADAGVSTPPPTTLTFAGHRWVAQSGVGPPGPNTWTSANAFVDANGDLHLKLTYSRGRWLAAEVYTEDLVGFGHYAFQVRATLGALDPRVIFDLYNYGSADGVDEIDVEYGRYGVATAMPGHFVVYPHVAGTPPASLDFGVPAALARSTQTLDWSSSSVAFRASDDATGSALASWTYAPSDPTRLIPQDPARFHISLWLWQGRAPSNRQPVEVVVHPIAMP